MFTGIIEGLGLIKEMHSAGRSRRLVLEADFDLDQTKIGDSIYCWLKARLARQEN